MVDFLGRKYLPKGRNAVSVGWFQQGDFCDKEPSPFWLKPNRQADVKPAHKGLSRSVRVPEHRQAEYQL
jgi:hypothetical protein